MKKNSIEFVCQEIANFLKINNGSTIEDFNKFTKIDNFILLNILKNWQQNWNSYFEFGRLFNIKNKWYIVDSTHILAREQDIIGCYQLY